MKTLNCVLALGILFLSGIDLWAIPAGFNIQGRLTDANGINKSDTFSIKFSVFATASGGFPVWEQTQSVLVQNGNFQVVLRGEGQGPGGTTVQLEEAVKDLADAHVEIKVGAEQPLVPRQQLLRSPFSPADKFLGAVMFFAGPTCPAGWELANGKILDTTAADAIKYADLISYLGTTYDPNHTQHMLPNMIDGSFIRSIGGNATNLGKKQLDAFKSHSHLYHQRPYNAYRGSGSREATSEYSQGAQTEKEGEEETRPLNYAMTPCIKY